jgi:hypothetical protein
MSAVSQRDLVSAGATPVCCCDAQDSDRSNALCKYHLHWWQFLDYAQAFMYVFFYDTHNKQALFSRTRLIGYL